MAIVAAVCRGRDQEIDDLEESEMADLLRRLPTLAAAFSLHGKIGEGTFSSVWLGSLKRERHVQEEQRRSFAIKHLLPTAHPARIEHELRCLRELGGRDNIVGVELCLRHLDTVVFVMPYMPHPKFSEYVLYMDAEETQSYMRALLQALCRVHEHGVIHRDIKPSNFLYDRTNRRYLLVDFGLAQRVSHITHKYGADAASARRKRTAVQAELESETPRAKRLAATAAPHPHSQLHNLQHLQHQLTLHKSVAAREESPAPPSKAGEVPGCTCWGRGAVCEVCGARGAGRAPRAGTQGFRPPEVLLQYPHQTPAVDMWACGVMLLSVLSGRYPFFRASDDISALGEFSSLFGTACLERAALRLGRKLVCSERRQALCLRKLCARLRSRALHPPPAAAPRALPPPPPCTHCALPREQCVCCDANDTTTPEMTWCGFPDSAFELLMRLLTLDPRARITAAAALSHPFLTGGGNTTHRQQHVSTH